MIILMNSLIFDDTYQSLILSLFTFCNLSHPSVSQDLFFSFQLFTSHGAACCRVG